MPTVSVIIPTYRHQEYVLATIESVFAQTFTDYELIVVNDGSPDDTGRILEPLARSNRIRYLEQTNRGAAAARNRGLAEARGEFVAFLDDDDLWPPDKLEWQVALLHERSAICVVGGEVEYIGGGVSTSATLPNDEEEVTIDSLFRGNPFVSPGQTLIRGDDLKAIGGLNNSLWGVDDYDLWFRLLCRRRIVKVRRVALKYRVHEDNASKDIGEMFAYAHSMLTQQLRRLPRTSRPARSREAYSWLYAYLGTKHLHQFRSHIRRGEFRAAIKNLKVLVVFLFPSIRDRNLAFKIGRELFSVGARRWLRTGLSSRRS